MKFKNNKKKIFLLILGISLSLLSTNMGNINLTEENIDLSEKLNLLKVSEKIHINNNWSAVKAAGICSGNGTLTNPYLIEDLVIDAGHVGSCIFIENSDDYFMILNCSLTNAENAFDLSEAGIKLWNVSYGSLINNSFIKSNIGMYFYISKNITLIGNSITSQHERGIRLVNCDNFYAYLNNIRGTIYDLFIQDSTLRFYSRKEFNYTYNGRTFTNYIGNYWRAYPGSDEDNDGIGDEIHHFEDGVGIDVDLYPLIAPTENYDFSTIIIPDIPDGVIPGYDVFLLLGIFSILSIFIINKRRK
ncbi:MAG: NosD domain-containing protein [Promethearchaeota archaeon]